MSAIMAGIAVAGQVVRHNSNIEARHAQENATREANSTQERMYDQSREDNAPWREVGARALTGLEDNKFMDNFQGDPGYQFRLQQGQKALEGSAAARGGLNSGATMKALSRYNQNFASNEYNNAYGRDYNRLSQLAGFGGSANANQMTSNQNYGNQIAGNQIGLGNAQAASSISSANGFNNLLSQGITAYSSRPREASDAGYFSDERLKTNIKPISKEEITELRATIKPYLFNYVSDEHGQGEWVGVMAQDLEKSRLGRTVVFEDENGLKKIDSTKLMSLFLAVMAEV